MNSEQGLVRARMCALTSLALLVAVIAAGAVRSAGDAGRTTGLTSVPEESVSAFATDRDSIRSLELETLSQIASDPTASDEIRSEAQRRRMQMLTWMEQEAAMEEVLSARGYDVPVITVHEDSVNVVLRAEALSREQAGIILELVTRETGVTGGNVKIIPIN